MENLKDSIKKEGSISQNIDKNFYLEYYYLYRDELIRSLKDNKNLSDLNGER